MIFLQSRVSKQELFMRRGERLIVRDQARSFVLRFVEFGIGAVRGVSISQPEVQACDQYERG